MNKYFKFFLAYYLIMFSFLFNLAYGQQKFNKPVMCANTEKIINTLTGSEYEEKPFWMGVDERDHTFSIFYNKNTTAWTIIEFKGQTACVLGAGDDSQLSQELVGKK